MNEGFGRWMSCGGGMRDVEELSDKVIWQPARQANNQTVAKQSNKRRLNMETLHDMSQTQSEER